MPGYKVFIANGEDITEFICIKCNLLVKDPIQLENGERVCATCLVDDVAGDEKIINKNSPKRDDPYAGFIEKGYFPDFFARRIIHNIRVYCKFKNHSCSWVGPVMKFEKHVETCDKKPEICSQCGAEVEVRMKEKHLTDECPNRISTCEFCSQSFQQRALINHLKSCPMKPEACSQCDSLVLPEKMVVHQDVWCEKTNTTCPFQEEGCQEEKVFNKKELAVHIQETLIFHILLLLTRVKALGKAVREILQNISTMKDDLYQRLERLNHLFQDIEEKVLRWIEFIRTQIETHWDEIRLTKKAALECKDELREVITLKENTEQRLQEIESKTFFHESQISEQMTAYTDIQEHLTKIGDRIEALRGAQYELRVVQQKILGQVPSLDLRAPIDPAPGTLDYHVSTNGELIWKVANVTRKRQDAILNKITSIFSPPFFTSQHGYKLCARLFLNGDGHGKGKYLSLFFAVMRGPYDGLLDWPFSLPVKMVLLDQARIKDHEESFNPDQTSSSFKRPTKDINISSGSPCFFPLDALDKNGYVVDDTLYIKIKIG